MSVDSAKPGFPDLTQTSSTDSNASVNINDYEFCAAHGREVCQACGFDSLEDNDFVAGVDHVQGREPIEVAFSHNKNGEFVCKKHSSTKDSCFQFKKQITTLSKAAAKSNKKAGKNKVVSNLIA